MNIGILNWRDLAHPDAGGAEVFVHEVGHRWADAGHDVTLYSSLTDGLPENDQDGHLRIKRIGHLKSGQHHLLAPRHVVRDKPQVVLESINTIPYFLPSRRGEMPPFLPLVHQLAVDVWESHLPKPLAAAAAWIEPRLYSPYREVPAVAVSESTKRDLLTAGVGDVDVIPQGGIGPQPSCEKEKDPTIIFVGRLCPNKRPDHAIEAFRYIKGEMPTARLWMVGEGEMYARLSKNLPAGAEMLGRVPRNDLLNRMARAHLLIATSVREGWGLVVTEANALGTPAVTYEVPGLIDSVREGSTGFLTDQNPASLAKHATGLLSDSGRLREVSEAAKEWGEKYTWDRTARELLEQLIRREPALPTTISLDGR